MEAFMNSKLVTLSVGILFLFTMGLFAQDFNRSTLLDGPETNLNNGGWGAMIAGVDLDGDGNTEIYLVNDNWNDSATELIPRIYKLEKQGDNWEVVWKAVAPIAKQNTWPPLVIGDLDGDGKPELIWAPINFTDAQSPNPLRILVYELDEGDVFGVETSETNAGSGEPLLYAPNASWTILDGDNLNFRPTRILVHDIDGDGKDEIIIADRAGESAAGGHFFAVLSVSDIPDNGDGSETWTMEVSGMDFLFGKSIANKWDAAVIENRAYFFCEDQITKLMFDGNEYVMSELSPLAGGSPFLTAKTVDLNNDGTLEIIAGVYDWGDDAHKAIVLIQESGDTLTHTELFNLGEIWPSGTRGPVGSAMGDIDGDGYMDFIFGSRASTPNAAIMRLAYRGGDITNPDNYEFGIIDSEAAADGIWNVIALANIDNDPALEVLYTSSIPAGGLFGGTQPIFALDYTGPTGFLEFDELILAEEVLLNGATPEGLRFKPGRILDNGNTVWFCGMNNTTRETWVFRSIDGGKTFTHNATAIPGRAAQVDAFDANIAVVATAEGKIWRTEDGSATWTEVYSYMITFLAPGWFDGIRVLNDNVAVAFGDMEPNGFMHFARSEDKGATWTEITGIDYMSAAYGYYTHGGAATNVGESIWCIATTMEYDSSYIFRSYDAGVNWDSFMIPKDVIATYPRNVAFSDNNNGLIADRRGNVVKSTDGGETWSASTIPDSGEWVNGLAAIPNTNIIVGMDDKGVFATTNLGATWTQITAPEFSGDYMINGVFLNKDFGYVFTQNSRVLRFKNQATSIRDQYANKVPAEFHLFQNYPNPFNPTTQISFLMPRSAEVKVVIYDMLGRKIRTVFEGQKGVGLHTVTWDGKNEFGIDVASGTYIYNLVGKDVNISRRMQFVK